MTVVELQDIAEVYAHRRDGKWWFAACLTWTDVFVYVSDPDFLVAATKLICEAKRMREAAR